MKYQSEIIPEIVEQRGHKKSSLHYQSECVETWIEEAKGAYPKLGDYQAEWLNYISILDDTGGSEEPEPPIGAFPYETVSTNTTATVNNVVPYAYKSAILKGSTKYRDIDTGEILEAFEEGRNLELVTVKMPVLKTTGKNLLYDVEWEIDKRFLSDGSVGDFIGTNVSSYINVSNLDVITFSGFSKGGHCLYDKDKSLIGGRTLTSNMTIDVSGADYIRVLINNTKDYSNPQMEVGSAATSYEPHKSNILTINEDVSLRGIGDVQDTLDCLTGEVVERIGEIVLDGTQDMVSDSYGVYIQVDDAKRFLDYTDKIACDKLPVIPSHRDLENVENGISGYANSNYYLEQNWLYVKINNSINTDEVKEWMAENPITVQYQRVTDTVKTVDLFVTNQDGNTLSTIKPIEGTMHITPTGESIAPTAVLEVPVEAITQNLASFIEGE